MNKEKNEAHEKLERLCNTLADDIETMSDEELIAELEDTGEDVNAIAKRTGELIADAIAKVGRRKLATARAGYETETRQTSHGINVLQWPVSRKRDLIQHFAENDAELEQKLTLAAREGKDTEADMNSFIEDLIDLGVIDDKGNLT